MHSTVERLEDVLKGLRKLTTRERSVVCLQCSTKLTTSGQIFTVEGAEGATSTYVNDHGAIHQIMTLRQVNETKIGFQGRASIENTYFPGYCWLISYCRNCYSHLGWKFQKVDDSPNRTNRPESFWGFMSSNVKTSSRWSWYLPGKVLRNPRQSAWVPHIGQRKQSNAGRICDWLTDSYVISIIKVIDRYPIEFETCQVSIGRIFRFLILSVFFSRHV